MHPSYSSGIYFVGQNKTHPTPLVGYRMIGRAKFNLRFSTLMKTSFLQTSSAGVCSPMERMQGWAKRNSVQLGQDSPHTALQKALCHKPNGT